MACASWQFTSLHLVIDSHALQEVELVHWRLLLVNTNHFASTVNMSSDVPVLMTKSSPAYYLQSHEEFVGKNAML